MPATSRQHGDKGVEPLIIEFEKSDRMVAMHRQRHFLKAQVLQQVEDEQWIGKHRQREVVAAQAERRCADDDRGDGTHQHPKWDT